MFQNIIYYEGDPSFSSSVSVEFVSPFTGEAIKAKVLSARLVDGNILFLHLDDGGVIEIDLANAASL